MAMKSRIFSSLSAHKNFLGTIFFLEKLFVLDQPVKRYNQHPCLRLNNFVSILTHKNYLSVILKKDKQKVYSISSNFTGSLARFYYSWEPLRSINNGWKKRMMGCL